jgi:uncharacterized cupredoxin-like copper-binding protein
VACALAAPGAQAAARTVDIEAGSNPDGTMYLRPSDITVDLGDVVTLRVHNPDRIFHDVALLSYDGEDIEIEVPAGKTEERTFTATKTGDFRLVCEVSGHKQKGMQGMLHVVDPAAQKSRTLPGPDAAFALAAALAACLVLASRRPRA